MIATPTEFPCGSAVAKKHIRLAFRNSTNDARTTITDFQVSNSLHCVFAKAFGTTPTNQHQLGSSSREIVEDTETTNNVVEGSHAVAEEESLDPSAALEFLSHLDVSRHEVHTRIASALRSAIEDEIQRMPILASSTSSSVMDGASSTATNATNATGEAGHRALLNLLKSAWLFRDVPELRPILICVLKRLGEATPVQMLRRLALKKNASEPSSSTLAVLGMGAASAAATGSLKYAELVSQLGPHLQRLVWEADWDEKLESARKCNYDDWGENEEGGGELTLSGKTILADMIWPSVEAYITDTVLVQQADLAFVGTLSERRFATKMRRIVGGNTDPEGSEKAGDGSIIASIGGGAKAPTKTGTNIDDKSTPSSALAVAWIKEVIGNRPKLLGAVLDMLIAEHATKGGGIGYDATQTAADKKKRLLEGSSSGSIVGGKTNLPCALVADILLSYGQLPRSYEVIEIMARILDAAVQSGFITDAAISQIQGCLRTIFRPSQSEQPQVTAEGTKIKLSLKTAKTPTSMFPDLPVDDSEYERKLLQRVLKKALASMKANDPQGLFLEQVSDDVAPGYSSIIDVPMCIRMMEEKMMRTAYKSINEYVDDTMLMFSNCCKYNTGSAGQYFRLEAERQKRLWKEEILPDVRSKMKVDLSKRQKSLKNKPKPPPALAFAPDKVGSGDGSRKRVSTDDTAINNLTAHDVKPLPPWKCKRRRTEIEIPNMQCLASMLVADPFVVRVLVDTIQRILRADVLKSKTIPSGHPLLPSLFQLLNIARVSTQLCAINGKQCYIPGSGIRKVLQDGEFCPSYESIRNRLPLVAKLLLDSELDLRMVIGGDLHAAASQSVVARNIVQIHEWGGGSSSLYDIRAVVEGAFVYLMQPGNTNELAIQHQFPRFVTALDKLSEGNMINERPFFMSLSHALQRYKSKLPHSIRDLVTACLIRWLKVGDAVSRKTVLCSPLHECFVGLLNEWSLCGNMLLSRDLFLTLREEAIAASCGVELGGKYNAFVELWTGNDECLSAVKTQYIRMLSNTPSSRALQWRERIGIDESTQPTDASNEMQLET